MSSLFSQVAEVFTRRQTKKVEDREALVTAILAGGKKAPTPAQIATALDEMDWTPEALEKEVTRRQQRQADAAALAEVPALEQEKAELERKGRAEVARYRGPCQALAARASADHRRLERKVSLPFGSRPRGPKHETPASPNLCRPPHDRA